jgi:hypothetical protein
MKLPTKVKRKVSGRKLPRGTRVALGVITGFAAGTGAVLKGREAVRKAAVAAGTWAERKGG